MSNKRQIDHKLQWGSVGDCQDSVTAIRHVQRFDIFICFQSLLFTVTYPASIKGCMYLQ